MRGLHEFDFYSKVTITRYGPVNIATLGNKTKFIEIDMDNPLVSLKKVDRLAEYIEFKTPPTINSDFLFLLSKNAWYKHSVGRSVFIYTTSNKSA